MPDPADEFEQQPGDAEWFRPPTRREHWIAAGLFVGFGVFFVLLSFVWAGHWFRWVILGLGVYSTVHGLRHALDTRHAAPAQNQDPHPDPLPVLRERGQEGPDAHAVFNPKSEI